MVKPGYRTSEFWFTLVSFVFSGLYLVGVIGDMQQKDELIANVSHAVESCILIGGQAIVLYKYIKGRTQIKETWWNTATPAEREELLKIHNSRKKKKKAPNATKKPSARKDTSTDKSGESDS